MRLPALRCLSNHVRLHRFRRDHPLHPVVGGDARRADPFAHSEAEPLCGLDAGGLPGITKALRLTESNVVLGLTDGEQRF